MGLIIPLGEWVLKTACRKFKEYLDTYQLNVCLCVNISVVQMKDPNFINIVKKALEMSKLDPQYLELEITESVFIESYHDTSRLLTKLKDMGIKIALDDFGTGYSSLSYLKLLPIDILKIDRTFVNDMEMNAKQIVGDIISLAHNLDISVIAEGVEYMHQLDYLKKVGCDCVQGFLLGRPLDEEALKELLTHSSELFNHLN
jgi:EAL domain-containing protein (putative c-di-GMP-specific phosphodiesterase class I)